MKTIWPPIVAGLAALFAILADLFVEGFRAFSVAHAMITALVAMAVFALVTIWLVDWLSARREHSRRSGVTASSVRMAANLGWAAVSHRAMSWPNLRNSNTRAEAGQAVHIYQSFVATLALTPTPDENFYNLLSAHDQLCTALDEYIERDLGETIGKDQRFTNLVELQAAVDAASWPYIQKLAPEYWKEADRFTPPFVEPPEWITYLPPRPTRRSPDPDSPNGEATEERPLVSPGSRAVSEAIVNEQWSDDAPF